MSQIPSGAVGDIPSGLFVVTVLKESGDIDGFLASFVQQVSFDPLRIAVAIKPERLTYEEICSGDIFCLNVVGTHNKEIMKPFWNGYEKNPFENLDYEVIDGAVLLKEAKSSIICKIFEKYSPGDHDLVVADVLACHDCTESSETLVHLRKDGSGY